MIPDALIESQFPQLRQRTYLNTAAEALLPRASAQAVQGYLTGKQGGSDGRPAMAVAETQARAYVARLLEVDTGEIAFLSSTARGINTAVQSLDWQSGDTLVISDLDYPTNLYVAQKLARERGVRLRIVQNQHGSVHLQQIADALDRSVKAVVTSLVSFKSGARFDLPALAELVHANGSYLIIDAVQAMGVVPVAARYADFLVAGTYKWLLGIHGLAIFYVNRALHDRLTPPGVGWRSVPDLFARDAVQGYTLWPDARKYEEGMPNFPALYALNASLDLLLELGIQPISGHVAALADRALRGLRSLQIDALTPAAEPERAGIVSFTHSRYREIAAALHEQQITVWGRDGRVRISPHFYNSTADIDRFLDALDGLLL